MPIYTVEGPDGRRYKIEGPEGATPDQLAAVIQQQAPQPAAPVQAPQQAAPVEQAAAEEPGTLERLWGQSKALTAGVVEPVRTIVQGGVGEVAGGLAGLAGLAAGGGDIEKARQWQDATTEAVGYQPKTVAGNAALQTAMAPAMPAAVGAEVAREKLGDAAYERGGAVAGTAAYTAPDLLLSLVPGAKAAQFARRGAKPPEKRGLPAPQERAPDVSPEQLPPRNTMPEAVDSGLNAKDRARVEQIRAGSTDGEVAPYQLDDWSGVKKDPRAQKVLDQGFDEGYVAAIKQASPADRAKMRKMLEIRRRGHRNKMYQMDNRPSDVAGDSVLQRVRHIYKVNRKAGRQLELEARKLRGQPVDYSGPVSKFVQNLQEMRVELDKNLKPTFRDSDVEGVKPAERILRNVIGRMRNTKVPDAYDLHRLKRFIDEHVTYGKSKDGLGGKTEKILKELRHDINQTLRANFDDYARTNQTYAETIDVLDRVQKAAGSKIDLTADGADAALGTTLRGLTSNNKGRQELRNTLADLDEVAKKHGAKFEGDIKSQLMFAQALDDQFGPVARTSLGGEVDRAAQTAVETAVGARGMGDLVAEGARAGLNKMKGVNDDNAFAAMRELLKD